MTAMAPTPAMCAFISATTAIGSKSALTSWAFLGWSVSLSADGGTVAIGATNNDGNAQFRPCAYLPQQRNQCPEPMGADIDGEAGDYRNLRPLSAGGAAVCYWRPFQRRQWRFSHVRIYEKPKRLSKGTSSVPISQVFWMMAPFNPPITSGNTAITALAGVI